MFHLLVRGDTWPQAHCSMELDRVIDVRECTNAPIVERYMPGGVLDTTSIEAAPALFVSEIGGPGSQQARVGRIIRARIDGSDVYIDYTFDSDIPLIPRVLLRGQAPTRLSPKVFKLDDLEGVDDKLISVMMPFDIRFDEVYTTIRTATEAIKLRCSRADEIWEKPSIIQNVVTLINRSRVVICDCTDKNPNVFYEAGIAHTLGREVILMAQSKNDIPFNLGHLWYLTYEDNAKGREQLAEHLKQRIQTLLGERTP